MNYQILLIFISLFSVPIFSQTVLQIVQSGNGDFTSLFNGNNLASNVNGTGPYTVFLPSNNFSLPNSVLTNSTFLDDIILYHVVNGFFVEANLTNPLISVTGEQISVNTTNLSAITLNDGEAVITNFTIATNGIVYAINGFLIPPSLSTLFFASQTPLVPGVCTNQSCCTQNSNPNIVTGDGYWEFQGSCLIGGLNCVDGTGCLLCHNGNISTNAFNRPLCGSGVFTVPSCSDQACCTNVMSPNIQTGYGFLEFNVNCSNGGPDCTDSTSCLDCFNPLSNVTNVLGRPICSAAAIASFNIGIQPATTVPITTQAQTATQVPLTTQSPLTTQITTQAATVTQIPTTLVPISTQSPVTTQVQTATQVPLTTQTPVTTQAVLTTFSGSEALMVPITFLVIGFFAFMLS